MVIATMTLVEDAGKTLFIWMGGRCAQMWIMELHERKFPLSTTCIFENYSFASDQFSSVQLSRFGGRLHIDLVGSEVERSFAIVEAGEKLRWFVVVFCCCCCYCCY